ncbi:benzoate-CoA ligase family protein [Fodinicurvata sp. EGI_FJ10296]|uniref:benzoate-CoA ligase family protein n=1 Tax=Fodinicurvata sp. EGI_FJ10296 TaxID=3231908 RepID=UPI0034535503
MTEPTAHRDTFARDNLPPKDLWPVMTFDLPELQYPERLNAVNEFLDKRVAAGDGDRPCILSPDARWTYSDLLARTNRMARVLTEDLAMQPGERVMLRAANTPMMVAAFMAVIKAGGVAVPTMPLLRARELGYILDAARVNIALTDERLADAMDAAAVGRSDLRRVVRFSATGETGGDGSLDGMMAGKPTDFAPLDTVADDVCLIAFTSGTTGQPKGTMHFHRDLLAICDTFARHVLKPTADDVFCGSPPLAFTFGLGGLVLFPMSVGASTYLLEAAPPKSLAALIDAEKTTVCFTAPTAWRALIDMTGEFDLSSLRRCVSAGEALPLPTWERFLEVTGIRIIDGIGATEMLHIFISAADDDIRPGATGKPVPGFTARVVDENNVEVPPGTVGRLAVRGPTGCRYLADDRQSRYVQDGWNVTGDAYLMDEDGYFWYQARTDDMIICSGYNIAGPEVEEALLAHPSVSECAVVGAPDANRGAVPKAFVILREGYSPSDVLAKTLQDFVKDEIAPYKYPRIIDFVADLPRTETGKLQRFRLRQLEAEATGKAL